jgi:cobalamin-dependent methionine synthase I
LLNCGVYRLDSILPFLGDERLVSENFIDPERGVEATKLFNDAKAMLERIIAEKWISAHAVIGLFPANAEGDDILVF